jgi:hypothetical protein
MEKLFSLGHCVITRGIQDLINRYDLNPHEFIARHHACDFSEMDKSDQQANMDAIKCGARIFSKYTFKPSSDISIDVFVITEAKDDKNVRNSTCILMADEY